MMNVLQLQTWLVLICYTGFVCDQRARVGRMINDGVSHLTGSRQLIQESSGVLATLGWESWKVELSLQQNKGLDLVDFHGE